MCLDCGDSDACEGTDLGAVDRWGDGCEWYDKLTNSERCGDFDDDDFIANEMCCACGGGAVPGNAPNSHPPFFITRVFSF